MKLVTLNDLDELTAENKVALVRVASQLSEYWDEWKRRHDGRLSVDLQYWGGKERKAGIHASEMSRCMRLLVYSIMGEERRPGKDLNMQRRFDVGTAMHAVIQAEMYAVCDWMQGQVTFEDEVKVSPALGGSAAKYNIHSSCDGVFTFWGVNAAGEREAMLRVGLEIKTASDKDFEKLKEPKADHKEQTCLYQGTLDVPLMWTLYYNKSNSNYTPSTAPWLFQFDKKLWEGKLIPRFEAAHSMAAARELPARSEGMQCRWCPFAYTCNPTNAQKQYNRNPLTERDF